MWHQNFDVSDSVIMTVHMTVYHCIAQMMIVSLHAFLDDDTHLNFAQTYTHHTKP